MTQELTPGIKGAVCIVGAQFGDEGKGKISAHLTKALDASVVYKAGVGPNAEHGIFLKEEGPYIKVNQLPLGWILSSRSQIRIGSGVVVNPELLLEEIGRFGLEGRVKIDYRCPILTREDIEKEKRNKGMNQIGSTMSGSGEARLRWIARKALLARDIPELQDFIADTEKEAFDRTKDETVIIESSQGTLLSLSSEFYPNVTSDNITTAALLDDVGLEPRRLAGVMLVVKSLPSREGNGPMGSDELTTDEIREQKLVEISSIGGAIRRKGTEINWQLLSYAVRRNGPCEIALTFLDHYDPRVNNAIDSSLVTDKVWALIDKIQAETGVPVTILETGKAYGSIIDLSLHRRANLAKIKGEISLPKDL